jgi:hypothetical protein
MTCAIMQPTYWPWVGGFDLMDQADVYVHYDDVQVVKRSWDVRNRIKTAQGELFLTVPLKKTQHRDSTLFTNAVIDDTGTWRTQHLKSIVASYRKAPFFDDVMAVVEPLLMGKASLLGELNVSCITAVAERIGIRTPMVRSSSLQASTEKKDARLVRICRELLADRYVSPFGAHRYIEADNPGGAFQNSGVELVYQNYCPVPYRQLHGTFLPHMCILDLLFNEGFDDSLSIIRKGRRLSLSSASVRGSEVR